MQPKILVTNKVPFDVLQPVENMAEVIMGSSSYELMSREEVMEVGKKAVAIVNQAELRVDKELLDALPKLRIVANVSIGINNLDVKLLQKQKVWASNTPVFFAYPVAEYVLAGMLMISRRLLEADKFVRDGKWNSFQPSRWDGDSLINKTLGLIGYGSIARQLARIASAMGMNILVHDISACSEYENVSLQTLMTTSDFLSVHVPLTERTFHLINKGNMDTIKDGAIVINTARGEVIEDAPLLAALQSGKLKGAVLDVFEFEPRVSEALKIMSNVLLTPHIAGGTNLSRHQARLLAFQNVAEVLQGRRPLTPVNELL